MDISAGVVARNLQATGPAWPILEAVAFAAIFEGKSSVFVLAGLKGPGLLMVPVGVPENV